MQLGCGCSVSISLGSGLFAGAQHLIGVRLSMRPKDSQVELGLRMKTGACVIRVWKGLVALGDEREN